MADVPDVSVPDSVQHLAVALGEDVTISVTGGEPPYARPVLDVPRERWADALILARDEHGFGFFDWLTAVDFEDEGYDIVAHLWNVPARVGTLFRTRISRGNPSLRTVINVFPGAAWHERETYEMFGISFDGHDGLKGLLLPDEFVGHPLRKEFVLASRAVKEWPGHVEPGHPDAPRKRRMLPPGVPDEPWPLNIEPHARSSAGDELPEKEGGE